MLSLVSVGREDDVVLTLSAGIAAVGRFVG